MTNSDVSGRIGGFVGVLLSDGGTRTDRNQTDHFISSAGDINL